MEVSDQLHAPAALPSGKEPLVPIGLLAEVELKTEIRNDLPNLSCFDTRAKLN